MSSNAGEGLESRQAIQVGKSALNRMIRHWGFMVHLSRSWFNDWLAVKQGSIRGFPTNSDFWALMHWESRVAYGTESICLSKGDLGRPSKRRSAEILYKGTGDGFIAGIKNGSSYDAIDFCRKFIELYITKCSFIEYRIGIVYGTFFTYWGISNIQDLFGSDVIKACRISDFGNKKVVLISSEANDNIVNQTYRKCITEIGNCIDKHRRPHYVYNYCDNIMGSDFYSK